MAAYSSLSLASRRAGLAMIGTAGLLSTLSSASLLGYILYCILRRGRRSPLESGVHAFAQSSMGKYFFALLTFDMIQGLAFSINLRWAHRGDIVQSPWCIAQGAVSQVGDLGIAIWSLVIAFHTFWLLFLQRKPAAWVTTTTLIVGNGLVLFMPLLGSFVLRKPNKSNFWGPSGLWCWVANDYKEMRIPFFYLWAFMFLIASMVLYPLVYLKFAGVVNYTGSNGGILFRGLSKLSQGSGHQPRPSQSSQGSSQGSGSSIIGSGSEEVGASTAPSRHVVNIAKRLMWYPVVYCVIIIPVSVCRIGGLAGWQAPFWLYAIAGFFFAGSGLSDSALFLFTRQVLIQTARGRTAVRVMRHRVTVIERAGEDGGGPLRPSGLEPLEMDVKRPNSPAGSELRFAEAKAPLPFSKPWRRLEDVEEGSESDRQSAKGSYTWR